MNESGKRSIVFNRVQALDDNEVTLPCGRCIGCRLDYSRNWAVRCVHEAQMHLENSFITLTFNPEHLPEDRSVHKEHLQKFFKRLRKQIEPKKIRYFACGEYGDENKRPHYHAIVFGHSFPDKLPWTKRDDTLLYRSASLEKAWSDSNGPIGYCSVGDVTFQSAAYVARYAIKKMNLDKRDPDAYERHYTHVDQETGEIFKVQPEFCVMSRRPGIGKEWLEKFKSDTDKDFITIDGKTFSLPKYYDDLLQKMGEDIDLRKEERKSHVNHDDQHYYRLISRQHVKEAQLSQLIRKI